MSAEPRAATVDDLDGVVETLTAAFLDDPVMSWSLPDRTLRPRRLAALWRLLAGELYLPGGDCATTAVHDDGHDDGRHDAVALWWRHGSPDTDEFWTEHGARFAADMGDDLERLGAVGATMAAHHPHDRDHWYLMAVGVVPTAQGRGLGGALLAHTLERIDRLGHAAYLEATSARSRVLYERHGFVATGELRAAVDAPPLWPMWREPPGGTQPDPT